MSFEDWADDLHETSASLRHNLKNALKPKDDGSMDLNCATIDIDDTPTMSEPAPLMDK